MIPGYSSSRNISEDGSNAEHCVFVYRPLGNNRAAMATSIPSGY